jgi:hypothetical protein
MSEDTGEVTEQGEVAETEVDAGQQAETLDADRIAALEQEVQELRALRDSGQQETEEKFEPKPLFTDEELEQMDDERKPELRALNETHLKNQILEHRIEQLEAGKEAAGQKENIQAYIDESPKLSADPKLAKAFQERLAVIMKGNGAELLDAIRDQVLAGAKGKPDPSGSTSKPRSVAGSTRTDVTPRKMVSVEQGLAEAKKEILEEIRGK